MESSVYIETSIISYLTAKPSRQILLAAKQQVTQAWWDNSRNAYRLFISQAVLDETSLGDAKAAARRSAALVGLPLLDVTDRVGISLQNSCGVPISPLGLVSTRCILGSLPFTRWTIC